MQLPTVKIKLGEGYAVINESDFDPKKMELFEGESTGYDFEYSPAAEKLALANGINLADVYGTGKDGYVKKSDVQEHLGNG